MYDIYNLTSSASVQVVEQIGPFMVLSYGPDPSLELHALTSKELYEKAMVPRQRQLICTLENGDVRIAEGMMQWMVGDVEMVSGVSNPVSYFSRLFVGRLTEQKAIAPIYTGLGTIALEPVRQEIMLLDLSQWPDGIVIASDLFLACSADVTQSIVARKTVSSALFGSQGLFSMELGGDGVAAIACPVSRERLLLIELEDDVLRIDGDFALAWSGSLSFTVENASETVTSSVISKEGMVNTYRGTGRVLMAPFGMDMHRSKIDRTDSEDSIDNQNQ